MRRAARLKPVPAKAEPLDLGDDEPIELGPSLTPWRVWLLAARPATLTAVLAPLLVGGVLAGRAGGFEAKAWLAALGGAFFIQIGTNFANDVFDFEKGADTTARRGPLRVTQAGLVEPGQVKFAMVLAFALATACGSYLVALHGWPLVAVGVASIAAGVLYTGGPWPLGYLGLGDLFVFAFFGVVATAGATFVQLGHVPAEAWWWSIPIGASCTAILVVNNLRDAPTDVLAGKRTLAVRFGPGFARAQYVALMALALFTAPVWAAVEGRWWLALPLVCAPLVARWAHMVSSTDDPDALNYALAGTAKLHLALGAMLALGLAIDGGL